MTEVQSNPWDALAGPTTRAPRTSETRERTSRKRTWSEPSILPTPEPEDGWVFKWVRAANRGVDDKTNFQKRLREGWEAVQAEDYPELMTEIGVLQRSGLVENGGLVLCKMPQEMVDQRTRHYQNRTNAEMNSAEENYMRDSNELMKKVAESKRKTVFGR